MFFSVLNTIVVSNWFEIRKSQQQEIRVPVGSFQARFAFPEFPRTRTGMVGKHVWERFQYPSTKRETNHCLRIRQIQFEACIWYDIKNHWTWFKRLSSRGLLCQLFLTMPITSATAERSFSASMRIKTYLLSTQWQDQLWALAIIAMEKEMLNNLRRKAEFYDDEIKKCERGLLLN